MKRVWIWALCLALLLGGCGGSGAARSEDVSRELFAMDTYMTLRAFGADAAVLESAEALIREIEAELSVTTESSAVYQLNETGAARFSSEAAELARRALALCAETNGALDLTVYPVVRAWGFTTGEHRVPERGELDALCAKVDHRQVQVADDGTVTLPEGFEMDLGAVTKGWLGERLCAYLRERGVESALLDLGGNVQTLGGKPDGSAWRVGVRDPDGEGLLGVVEVRDEAVVTSGGYERYFTDEDGTVYWHVLDPSTGMPARNGLISVTVVGAEGLRCDGLSTALFVLGQERAAAFWRASGDFEMLLVTEDGRLLLTPGLAARFTPDAGLCYTLEVLSDVEN